MIEFNGNLSKKTARYYFFRYFVLVYSIFLFSSLSIAPVVFFVQKFIIPNIIIQVYSLIFLGVNLIFLLSMLPVFQKKMVKKGPNKILLEENILISSSPRGKVIRSFEDVIEVKEFQDFYVMCFNRYQNSYEFVCQKDLLSKGTLEEFEELFKGKIVKKTVKK